MRPTVAPFAMRALLRLCCWMAAGMLLAACDGPRRTAGGDDGGAGGPFLATDSAGVRVITFSANAFELAVPAVSATEPVWRTGWRDSEPSFETVVSGYLLPKGGAVVADGAKRRVHVLSPTGRVEATFGRRGEGPGELRSLHFVAPLPPDSILVTDGQAGRVWVYSPTGEPKRSFPLPPVDKTGHLPGRMVAGRLLYYPYAPASPDHRFWRWVDGPLLSSDVAGGDLDTLRMAPRGKALHAGPGSARHGVVGAFPGGWVWASNADTPIHWYTPDGDLAQVFRDSARRYDGTVRVFWQLVVGQDGSVWRREGIASALPGTYLVIDGDGVGGRRVTVPERFRLLDATEDRILGVWEDELGIEAVAVLSIGPLSAGDRIRSWMQWLQRWPDVQ